MFEAGVQPARRRAGSFSFLTWSFFIAPLIACEEFLAAMFKSAEAVEENAEDAPKPSTAPSEAVAAAVGGGGGGGGGDDADSRYHDAHTSIDDIYVNSLSVNSLLA